MKWPEVPLSKVADINPSRPRNLEIRENQPVSFVPMPAVSAQTAAIEHQDLRPYLEVKKGFTYFEENDVLFAKITPCMENGKSAIASGLIGGVGFGSTEFHVIRSNQSLLLPKYIHYFVRQQSVRDSAKAQMRGAVGQQRVPKDFFDDTMISLPTISEQHRIVEILDQADRLRKLRAHADAKAQRILPALFIKMFGDPAMNPKGWNTVLFAEFVEIGTQLVDPNHPDFLDLPHIGGEHIEKETGRILSPPLVKDSNLLSNKFYFSSDHILLSKIRPYLNKVAYPRFNGVCSADIYPLRPKDNNVTHWYLVSLLRTQAFLDYAKVHSDRLRIPKLNKAQLGAFEFPLPDPNLITAFDERVEKIISVENFRFTRQEKIEKLYQLVLHRAFTGDLTSSWRESHMKDLLSEMEAQAKVLEAKA